jgi:alpha-2-macroglobulin
MLAGAFALSGDKKTYTDLIPAAFKTEEAERTSGGFFDSPIRANAMILNVLLETDPNSTNVPRYIKYLSDQYKKYSWYSTQDDAFTLLAMGKVARQANNTKVTGTLTIGGKDAAYNGGNQKLDIAAFGEKASFKLSGTGKVYYALVTEGIRTDGAIKEMDKNLKVRREVLNREGKAADLKTVKQNDLLVIKITVQSSVTGLQHIAVTDMLPAGFEVENPRLTATGDYAFIKNPSTPDFMDIRDDRVNFYTNFQYNKEQTFYYAVRAVTQGEFIYAPVVAEAMYDGEYYSANGKTTVSVAK